MTPFKGVSSTLSLSFYHGILALDSHVFFDTYNRAKETVIIRCNIEVKLSPNNSCAYVKDAKLKTRIQARDNTAACRIA